jgi:SulP family sulfate permease
VANQLFVPPKVFILRMRLVPLIDASGVHALERFAEKLHKRGTLLILSGVQPAPGRVLQRMGFVEHPGRVHFVGDFVAAQALARQHLADRG